ncbi:MAG TPA: hypothetical protein VHT30_11045 [Acidimicrobiales bacterium]|jgi:quercetin dioxygenase-like cupin family protein|nr:hypothetical protein [Acidimicrobiales bacterium]
MPVVRPTEAALFEMHGARFSSYVSPSRGGEQLCAWRLDVPAATEGVAHRPSREEVVLVLEGALSVILDDDSCEAVAGDVVVVAAHSLVRIDGGPAGAAAWVTTTPGLEAVTLDGARIVPPWAQ